MLNSASTNNIPAESPPSYSSYQHACLTFTRTDRLRLFRFPQTIIDVIRSTINKTWLLGLQRETQVIDFYEFKFNGNPWVYSEDEYIPTRVMM
jgi:hypothetical protein